MTIYSQQDPKWASVRMGDSTLNIGRWGCAFISLINLWMALTGKTLSAKQLTAIAIDPKNFTNAKHKGGAGLVLWDKVCAALGGIEYTGREDGYQRKNIAAAIKDPSRGVILAVNKGAHFTTGWNVPPAPSTDTKVADPWYGKVVGAQAVYHNISGARYFARTE